MRRAWLRVVPFLRLFTVISSPYSSARTVATTSSRSGAARARYASMDAMKKAALLAKNRERGALLRAKKKLCTPGQFDALDRVCQVPWYLPGEEFCGWCGAYRFFRESPGFCCASGQLYFPKTAVSPIMWFLFTDPVSELAVEFRRRVRSYNGAFAFTSIGMKTNENSWWARSGIYALRVVGQVSHSINTVNGSPDFSKLLRLFYLDTADDLPSALLQKKYFRRDIMSLIIDAMAVNLYTSFFKRLTTWDDLSDAHIVLRSNSVLDQRNYNLPIADQVAAVWRDGDEGGGGLERDIRVFTESGKSRKISYYYGCYDPLQYPLLFTGGEPGWHAGIAKLRSPAKNCATAYRRVCDGLNVVTAANVLSVDCLLLAEDDG